jgi:2-polyprenyl-3-methyl-5-hydroxy-6-metoxy-1,4-benzoquinol methylase
MTLQTLSSSISCLLCQATQLDKIDSVSVALLKKMYKQKFNTEVSFKDISRIDLFFCNQCGLKFFYPLMPGDEKFYEDLQHTPWYYVEDKQEYDIASRFIEPSDKVLEIGAGRGVFSQKISCREYVGLEFSQAAITAAHQVNVSLRKESVESHAMHQPGQYDVVCAFQVLEHVTNVHEFIQSCLDCLKPGGKLIFAVPSEDAFLGLQADNILNMPPHHATRWTDRCLENVAKIFKLSVFYIQHDDLSGTHSRAFSTSLVQHGLRTVFKIPLRVLDDKFLSFPVKIFVKTLSMVIQTYLRLFPMRLFGHSVTVVYRKQ